jgi:peptidoglycan/LPS O-acetylase OafA/YrhL
MLVCLVMAFAAFSCNRPLLALWLIVPTANLLIATSKTPYLHRMGRFGDVSYGLYIYAFPVQQTLIWLFDKRLAWLTILILTIFATAVISFLSWHFVEKQCLKLKPMGSRLRNKQEGHVGNIAAQPQ